MEVRPPDPLIWIIEGLQQEKPDEKAAKELMRLVRHYVCKCHRLNEDDIDEVVMETSRRVYFGRNAFERRSKVSTWICGIARNVVREHLRQKDANMISLEEVIAELPDDIDPEALAISNMAVEDAFKVLDTEEVMILEKRMDGEEYHAIGEPIGKKGNNIGKIIRFRIASKVAEALGHHGWLSSAEGDRPKNVPSADKGTKR